MMEESAQMDGGCTGESVQVMFDRDVLLSALTVSIFGSQDEGRVDIFGASRRGEWIQLRQLHG
jgi:hypothetical protein